MLPFLPFLSIYIFLFLHSFFNSSMSKLGVRFHYCANEMVLNTPDVALRQNNELQVSLVETYLLNPKVFPLE